MHRIKCIWKKFQYRCWLYFGGERTESGFRFLSGEILKNHKSINKLRSDLDALEIRVWELEDHTPEETMAKIKTKVDSFANRLTEFTNN